MNIPSTNTRWQTLFLSSWNSLGTPWQGTAVLVAAGVVQVLKIGVMVFKVVIPLPSIGADFRDKDPFIPNSNHHPPSNATSAMVLTLTRNTKVLPCDWSQTIMANGLTDHLVTQLFVSPSTSALSAVNKAPTATTATPVLCVVISHMALQNVLFETIFLIITKLKANAWELTLMNAGILNKFNDIPVGLRQGFFCGLENYSLSCTSVPPNHYISQEDEDFIVSKYPEEITLSRILHSYNPNILFSLIGHFRTAPLAVITRNGKCRAIVNHSFPIIKIALISITINKIYEKKLLLTPHILP